MEPNDIILRMVGIFAMIIVLMVFHTRHQYLRDLKFLRRLAEYPKKQRDIIAIFTEQCPDQFSIYLKCMDTFFRPGNELILVNIPPQWKLSIKGWVILDMDDLTVATFSGTGKIRWSTFDPDARITHHAHGHISYDSQMIQYHRLKDLI